MAVSLVELHLSHNGIKVVAGLESFTNLQVLDLSYKKLARQGDLRALSFNARLRVLSLVGNPLAKSSTAQELRRTVFHLLPALCSMDGTVFPSMSLAVAPSQKVNVSAAAAANGRFEVNSYLLLHLRAINRNTNQIATNLSATCSQNSASIYGLTYAQQKHLASRTPTFASTVTPPPSRSRLRYIPPWRRIPNPISKGWRRFNVPANVTGIVSPSARIESVLASAKVAAMSG